MANFVIGTPEALEYHKAQRQREIEAADAVIAEAQAIVKELKRRNMQANENADRMRAQAAAHAASFRGEVLQGALTTSSQIWVEWQAAEAAAAVYERQAGELQQEVIAAEKDLVQAHKKRNGLRHDPLYS